MIRGKLRPPNFDRLPAVSFSFIETAERCQTCRDRLVRDGASTGICTRGLLVREHTQLRCEGFIAPPYLSEEDGNTGSTPERRRMMRPNDTRIVACRRLVRLQRFIPTPEHV